MDSRGVRRVLDVFDQLFFKIILPGVAAPSLPGTKRSVPAGGAPVARRCRLPVRLQALQKICPALFRGALED